MKIDTARLETQLRSNAKRRVVDHEVADTVDRAKCLVDSSMEIIEGFARTDIEPGQKALRLRDCAPRDTSLMVVAFPIRPLGLAGALESFADRGEMPVVLELCPRACLMHLLVSLNHFA